MKKLTILIFLGSLFGCSKPEDKMLGTWVTDDGGEIEISKENGSYKEKVSLNPSKNITLDLVASSCAMGSKYDPEQKTIRCDHYSGPDLLEMQVNPNDANHLTLKAINYETLTLTRK